MSQRAYSGRALDLSWQYFSERPVARADGGDSDADDVDEDLDHLEGDLGDHPWRDGDLLRRLYNNEELTQRELAKRLGCHPRTVRVWMRRHDIPVDRDRANRVAAKKNRVEHAEFRTIPGGYEQWRAHYKREPECVYVHRLLAVAEYGFEAVSEHHVHHKNRIPWDNRPENIELMRYGDHAAHHNRVLSGSDCQEIVERYESGDFTQEELAQEYGVVEHTISDVINRNGAYDGLTFGDLARIDGEDAVIYATPPTPPGEERTVNVVSRPNVEGQSTLEDWGWSS